MAATKPARSPITPPPTATTTVLRSAPSPRALAKGGGHLDRFARLARLDARSRRLEPLAKALGRCMAWGFCTFSSVMSTRARPCRAREETARVGQIAEPISMS